MFPSDDVKIYCKNKTQKCFLHQTWTDIDSTCLFFFSFVFIWDVSCNLNEKILRNMIFQLFLVSKILSRLDVSDDFWVQYDVQRKELKKQLDCTKF